MKKTTQIFISLGFSFVLLLLIEGTCRFLYTDNTLDQIQNVIEEHPSRFWYQKRNIEEHNFFGREISTNDKGMRKMIPPLVKASKNKILVLGASPSFGWGVRDSETYSSLLQKKINQTKQDFQVINASGIGYSSHQGLKLLKEILNQERIHSVIISYVINDIDHSRFYRNSSLTDIEISPESNIIVRVRNFLSSFYLYKNLQRILKTTPSKSLNQVGDLPVRVSPSQYYENLESFYNICKKHKINLIFLKMPVKITSYSAQKVKSSKEMIIKTLNQRANSYHNIMSNYAKKKRKPLIDLTISFKEKYLDIYTLENDSIHPNKLGHEIIANDIFNYLAANIFDL